MEQICSVQSCSNSLCHRCRKAQLCDACHDDEPFEVCSLCSSESRYIPNEASTAEKLTSCNLGLSLSFAVIEEFLL